MTATALFVGDASWDTTICLPGLPAPDEKVLVDGFYESAGGVAANAAAACAMAGTPARALVPIGDDVVGEWAMGSLTDRGVTIETDRRAGATSRAIILLESHGEKRLLLYPARGLYPSRQSILALDLSGVGWVHTAVYDIAAAESLISRCRDGGVPWSVDLEPATFSAGIESLARVLDGAAVVFCNNRAAAQLCGDAHMRLKALGVQGTVLTQGGDGAAWQGDAASHHVHAKAGPIVDTTGAGDCLAGWFIAEMLLHGDPLRALGQAVVAATDSCKRPGAQASFSTREQLSRAT